MAVTKTKWLKRLEMCHIFENDMTVTKTKTKWLKRPNICHIFDNDMTQGCQIWRWAMNQWCKMKCDAQKVMHGKWCMVGHARQVMHVFFTSLNIPCPSNTNLTQLDPSQTGWVFPVSGFLINSSVCLRLCSMPTSLSILTANLMCTTTLWSILGKTSQTTVA